MARADDDLPVWTTAAHAVRDLRGAACAATTPKAISEDRAFCADCHATWWTDELERRDGLQRSNAEAVAAFLRAAGAALAASGRPPERIADERGTDVLGWTLTKGTRSLPIAASPRSGAPSSETYRILLTRTGDWIEQRWERTEVRPAGRFRPARHEEGWGPAVRRPNAMVAASAVAGRFARQHYVAVVREALGAAGPPAPHLA